MFSRGKSIGKGVSKKTGSDRGAAAGIGKGHAIKPQEFMVDDITVVFTQKRVKNINLRVKAPDGHLEVSAPPWVDTATVEAFVRSKKNWIKTRQQNLLESPRVNTKELSFQEREEAKAQIALRAEPLLRNWEAVIGVQSQSLAYRYMTSRWGSCNPSTGRICLNVQLLNYPPECLEYVVVHELCHLKERGHGPRFRALMDHFMPDWQERRALLK